jgi:hypothetical protein
MRFVGGTYFFDVDETLLTDSERSEVRAIAEAGDPYRAQRLAESYELQAIRAIRAAGHEADDPFSEFISEVPEKLISEVPDRGNEADDPQFSEFISEVPENLILEVPDSGEGEEPHQVTPLAQPMGTQVHESAVAGPLFQMAMRPTRAPAIALALILLAVLAAGALLMAAVQKLGVL